MAEGKRVQVSAGASYTLPFSNLMVVEVAASYTSPVVVTRVKCNCASEGKKDTQEFYEGKPAVTTRKLGKGTVTYVGVDSTDGLLEKDILKKLYAQLNIPVMDLPYGVTLEYRNGMGIVLNYTDKPYKFVLPSGAKVLIGEPVIPTAGVLVFSITD